MKRSRIKEPSSWGSLGAMLIAMGMLDPLNMPMVYAGIAACVLGIVMREQQ